MSAFSTPQVRSTAATTLTGEDAITPTSGISWGTAGKIGSLVLSVGIAGVSMIMYVNTMNNTIANHGQKFSDVSGEIKAVDAASRERHASHEKQIDKLNERLDKIDTSIRSVESKVDRVIGSLERIDRVAQK